MKYAFFAALGCVLFFSVAAQKKVPVNKTYSQQLRLQPLALVDPFESSVRFGMDIMLKPKLSVGADASIYFAADGYTKPLGGFAIAPAVRWYQNDRLGSYFETVLLYKHTERKETEWLGMDCVNGVPAYEKYDTYKRRKDVLDLSVRFGLRESLFGSPNWCIELFVGVGVRYKMYSIKYSEPNTCLLANDEIMINFFSNNPNPTNHAFFSVPAGLRLTRKLK